MQLAAVLNTRILFSFWIYCIDFWTILINHLAGFASGSGFFVSSHLYAPTCKKCDNENSDKCFYHLYPFCFCSAVELYYDLSYYLINLFYCVQSKTKF